MLFELPTKLNIGGTDYAIRSDYRAVLEICTALSDSELSDEERILVAMEVFYPDLDNMSPSVYKEALEKCFEFIDYGGKTKSTKGPRLMDWEQDFQHIVAPINRVAGTEIRNVDYMHWWTFLAYFNEIGPDCLFSQIVKIRDKIARHKKLDKEEKDWLKNNRHLVQLSQPFNEQDKEMLEKWGIK